MEISEGIAKLSAPQGAESALCEEEPDTYVAGNLVIDGIKEKKGDAAILRENMLAAGITEPDQPDSKPRGWDVLSISGTRFPYQTHHLLPEKRLKHEKITAFLTDSPKEKHPDYTLAADTDYDTNGHENGYFMPFASTTHQWKSTTSADRKQRLAFEIMRRTKHQLHQGRHSGTDYIEEGEDSKIETSGYHTTAHQLLDKIAERVLNHVQTCTRCRTTKQKDEKVTIRPLKRTVLFMHQASNIIKTLIQANRIFVSRRASIYYKIYSKDGILIHPRNPLLLPGDAG